MFRTNSSLKMSKSNCFLSRTLVIESVIIAQASLTPSAVQAQTSNATIDGNCGINRPFTKGTTTWSGWTSTTWGYVDASLYKWNGFNYVEVAYQYSEKQGSSATAAADAGQFGSKGWFEKETYHDFAHWSGPRSYIKGEFLC